MIDMQHNLVTILYTIKGFIEAHLCRLEEGRFLDRDEELSHAREAMKRVYAQTQRAMMITKKIGMAMKLSKERNEIPEPVSVRETWADVIKLLRKKERFHTEIINHIAGEFPDILCNPHDLKEILFCIADNAIQAMQGRGKLIIRTSLGFKNGDEPTANITLADTGPGISEEALAHLFEPFMTTKDSESGNGLGLYIVKGLIRKNGGSIAASSFTGCGSTFTLTFSTAKAKNEQLAMSA